MPAGHAVQSVDQKESRTVHCATNSDTDQLVSKCICDYPVDKVYTVVLAASIRASCSESEGLHDYVVQLFITSSLSAPCAETTKEKTSAISASAAIRQWQSDTAPPSRAPDIVPDADGGSAPQPLEHDTFAIDRLA